MLSLGAILMMYEGMTYKVTMMKLSFAIVILLIIFGVDTGRLIGYLQPEWDNGREMECIHLSKQSQHQPQGSSTLQS